MKKHSLHLLYVLFLLATLLGCNQNANDSTQKLNTPESISNTKVFGWHVYWMNNRYHNYDYSILTEVSYFSAEIDPNSGNIKLNGWDTCSIVNFVKSKKPTCKVLLEVSCFGKESTAKFLHNKTALNSFYDKIVSAIVSKKGDGICIDFEEIPNSERSIC